MAYWPSMEYQLVSAAIKLGENQERVVTGDGDLVPYLEVKYYPSNSKRYFRTFSRCKKKFLKNSQKFSSSGLVRFVAGVVVFLPCDSKTKVLLFFLYLGPEKM